MDSLIQSSGGNVSIEKVVSSSISKELKNKELLPDGPRQILLYVGDSSKFEKKFRKYIECKEKKVKEVKEHIEMTKKDGPEQDEEEAKEDFQEVFLRQFPGLSGHYARNKQIFKKDGKKPGFDI
jgi:hypothetical protein